MLAAWFYFLDMAYSNPATQVERGVRAFLLNQGKGTFASSFISLDDRMRIPNSRTFIVTSLMLRNPFRPQGEFKLEIQHIGDAIAQPDEPQTLNRTKIDAMVGETITSMFALSDGQSPLLAVADAITAAGRDLAVDTSNGANAQWAMIAQANQDMENFRVDWMRAEPILQTRGKAEIDRGSFFWMEVLNFGGYVSNASD
jgi:hypothetical protein